jgi:DivIVA domain-containing protein
MTDAPSFDLALRGYDRRQVDQAVELIRTAMTSIDPAIRAQARDSAAAPKFSIVLRGYNCAQVDNYLTGIARQLTA